MDRKAEQGAPTARPDEEILRDVELQRRAEKAWSDAWDRARRADEKAGRPYNRHTYADAAHRASVKVTGICRRAACVAHPRTALGASNG